MDITHHLLPYTALVPLHVLLSPARQGRLPEIVGEDRAPATGSEQRTVTVRTGDRLDARVYTGATLAGVGTAELALEQERVWRLRAALDLYAAELDAILAMRRGPA